MKLSLIKRRNKLIQVLQIPQGKLIREISQLLMKKNMAVHINLAEENLSAQILWNNILKEDMHLISHHRKQKPSPEIKSYWKMCQLMHWRKICSPKDFKKINLIKARWVFSKLLLDQLRATEDRMLKFQRNRPKY